MPTPTANTLRINTIRRIHYTRSHEDITLSYQEDCQESRFLRHETHDHSGTPIQLGTQVDCRGPRKRTRAQREIRTREDQEGTVTGYLAKKCSKNVVET